jgi:hypothetical protein
MWLVGGALIAIGCLYLKKPGVFRRGIWMKTSIAIRLLSEENYTKYMRGLGLLLIVIGLVLLVRDLI